MSKRKIISLSVVGSILLGLTLGITAPSYSKGVLSKFSSSNTAVMPISANDDEHESIDPIAKQKFLAEISDVYDFIKTRYYQDVDDTSAFEGALQGLMSNLGDPYSTYITPEKAKEYRENIRGEFGGLGIFINEGLDEESNLHFIKVVSPIEGTPAYNIGIRSGDLIIAIEEQNTANMSATEAVKIMRGKPGTKVELTIKRNKRVFKVTITREIIKTVDIRHDYIGDDIAYIRILRFTSNTPKAFKEALSQFDRGYDTLLIDLRDNPGGALEGVLQTIDYFFSAGRVMVGTESRIPSEQREIKTTDVKLVPNNVKVVVMINGGSASASEIFSGAIKDHNRGVLVGEKSFGKGLVQSVTPYKDGFITMTIAQYYTPSKTFINEIGIEPDVSIINDEIELTPEELIHAGDIQDQQIIEQYIEKVKGKLAPNSVVVLQKELDQKGLSIGNTEFLRRMLYIQQSSYNNIINTYSLEIDNVLAETVEKIRKNTL